MVQGKGLVLLILVCSALGAKLPSNLKICRRSDPNFSGCMKSAIEDTLPKIQNGIPELGAPRLQPLFIPSVTIDEGRAVNVVQKYTNMSMYDLVNLKVDDVKASVTPNRFAMSIRVTNPKIRLESDYDISGRLLVLPIVGHGRCTIILKDVKSNLHFSGKTFKKKGRLHLKATDFKLDLIPAKVTYSFGNLFNGDDMLGTQINELININWKSVFDDTKPGFEKLMSTVLQAYTNNIFTKIELEDLFPQ